ncbi:MAG: hypothetical protein QOE65_286 [Solirubrobacteraceae bacterium]|jgi:hypothetical protein|nr:hypothetical protein [Solirubrobacteraceae bacterium]
MNRPASGAPSRHVAPALLGAVLAAFLVWEGAQVGRLLDAGQQFDAAPERDYWLRAGHDLTPVWEARRRLELAGPWPADPDAGRVRLARLGIGWAILDPAQLAWTSPGELADLVRRRGRLVFADNGWSVYRLVAAPTSGRPEPGCRRGLRAGGCWAGPLDARPGLRAGEVPGVTARLRVCPGQTILADFTVHGEGAAAQIDFDDPDPYSGHSWAPLASGRRSRVAGTAPPGAYWATIGLAPGPAAVDTADVRRLGVCTADARP